MAAAIIVLALLATGFQPAAAQQVGAESLAPYVPTPQNVVDKMLEVAEIKPGEVVYDLGCGDGRVLVTAVKKYNAKAVGVELSPTLVKEANENIQKNGVEKQAKIIHGHLLKVDLSDADVVFLYLLTHSNELVRPRLERYLKPGARVVSHDFEVRGWKPSRVEKAEAFNREHLIYLYEMPPKK